MVTTDPIRTFRWAEPFRPFTIMLKTARRYPVRDPDRLAIRGGRIGLVEPLAIIDLTEIAGLVADDDGAGDAPP
jgi:hypothetical protein